jgi:hypothetical protein
MAGTARVQWPSDLSYNEDWGEIVMRGWTPAALLAAVAGGCSYAALRPGVSSVAAIVGAAVVAVVVFIALAVFFRFRSQR